MRFKSILGAFIFICVASILTFVIFIQTKTFGRLATKVITDLSERNAQTEVGIKSIGISIFPPGVELNQVSVKKEFAPDKIFKAEFGQLGFYIGLVELEERKLTLGEIRISDSTIDFTFPEDQDDEELKEIDKALIDKVFAISEDLPVRIDTLLLQNTMIFANHDIIEAKRLKLFKKGDSFTTRFHLANLKPLKEKDFSLDEIWGDASIGRKNISIYRLKVQHDVHTLLLKGKIKNYPALKNAEASVTGESSIYISNIKENLSLPEMIQLESGVANLGFSIKMKENKFSGKADLALNDLRSSVAYADQILASTEFDEDVVKLNKLSLVHNNESLKLLGPSEIFNFKNKKTLYQPLVAEVKEVELNNALRILPSLEPLKGKLTGEVSFNYKNGDLFFKPKDGFLIHNLGLIVGKEKPFTVLMAPKAKLTSSSFRVFNSEFQMDALVEMKQTLLDVHGFVNSKYVGFKVDDAIVDLEDFGNIADLDIKGKGTLDIAVQGPLEDTVINLKGKTQGFEILKYRLGQVDKDVSIGLKDSNVIIHKMEALYRNTPVSGTGVINYDNLDIALGINSQKANLHDLKEILFPIFSKLDFLPEDLDLNAKVDAEIFGKTAIQDLKLKADVQFTDLIAYGETLNSGSLRVQLKNEVISLKDLAANKGRRGQLRGDFEYSLETEKMKLNYEWENIALIGLNITKKAKLNLNGYISGQLSGEGTSKDYDLHLIGKMEETRTRVHTFDDSNFNMKISPKRVSGIVNFLGEIIKSDFNIALAREEESQLKLNVSVPEIKPFAIAFLGHHLETEEIDGELRFNLDTKFLGSLRSVDLRGNLETLVFKHENFNIDYHSKESQFLIENDKVKSWDLSIQQPDLFIQTKGEGEFNKNISLIHELHFNSRLFELLLAPVLSSEGFIRNIIRIDGNRGDYQVSASSKAQNLNFTIDAFPFPLNKLSYALEYSGHRLIIQSLKTSLENGLVNLEGDVFFDDNEPDVNIKYVLDKAEIPILGKSLVNISGEGIILGNESPYNVGGEIFINKAQLVNELNEFNSKSNALSQIRFLPPSQESPVGRLLNLNVNVKAENPIHISNSLMDVSLKGEVMILGNPARPRGEGRLYSLPNSSRVFFKNNEYFLTNVDLNFNPKKEITNPDFDVQAYTVISSYTVYAKAYGDLERFNFDLTSEPSLSRNSILSLIAFGYSDEIQSTLTQDQQQNLTQVGVGSFVFDRFKISDILNKQFGLQVNLGTVFEQSQTDSLLSGRTQEGQGTIGRTRSATKIELKKRLDEALSLSVSSTMGGGIGQRQSMNLNYSVSKKVQLEGVYELRTNAEGEEDIIDNSIGADIKFRWTFK